MAGDQLAKEVDQMLLEAQRTVQDREQREGHVLEIEEAILEAVSSRLFGPDLEPEQLERLVESSARLRRMVRALKNGRRVREPDGDAFILSEHGEMLHRKAHQHCNTRVPFVCRAGELWGRCDAGVDTSKDVVIN